MHSRHALIIGQLLQFQSILASLGLQYSPSTSVTPALNPNVTRVLSFWFDRDPMDWFRGPEGFDDECRSQLGHLVERARSDDLDDWSNGPEGSLALLVLLDQVPRNMFRGTPDAFSSDAKAQEVAARSIAKGHDRQATTYQALQFYLTLMHQENLLAQVASVALIENLRAASLEGSPEREFLEQSVSAAKDHLDVILRFGRYPSRNLILGRESTAGEAAFLDEHPSGFARRPASANISPPV